MDNSRKKFLQHLGAAAVFTSFPVAGFGKHSGETRIDVENFIEEGGPGDEKFWKKIARKYYDVARDHINLENGYYGIQPKTVLEAFQKNVVIANVNAAKFARKEFPFQPACPGFRFYRAQPPQMDRQPRWCRCALYQEGTYL